MISLEEIKKASYVVILTSNDSFADASALYTHILREHKKVSLVCKTQDVDNSFSFLPWFDKLRGLEPSSADLVIDMDLESESLYKLFKSNALTINVKIATALYAGLLKSFDGFLSNSVDGTTFALASELIELGADYKSCHKFMLKRASLSTLRLKANMLKSMVLINSSKAALFSITPNDLEVSGADLTDAYIVMQEALSLPYVELAILIDDKNEVLKLITEEI